MEYVTESLTVSGKWCTIFADKMKVKHGVGKTKIRPASASPVGRIKRLRRHPAVSVIAWCFAWWRFACRPDKALAPHPAMSVIAWCFAWWLFAYQAYKSHKCKKPAQRAGFLNLVGDRGLLATTWLALRAVADATFSRYARVEPLAPGGSHPRGFRKAKIPLRERAF